MESTDPPRPVCISGEGRAERQGRREAQCGSFWVGRVEGLSEEREGSGVH